MFRAFAFVMLLIPFFGTAQDYQMVRSDFVRFYLSEAGGQTNYHGVKIDSVTVIDSDTILLNYWHVRQWENDCELEPFAPSFLGRKIVVRPNGENLFFNHNSDTIRFNTTANLNDSWNFFDLEDGQYFRATVIEITNEVILDSLMEVKTIELEAVDSTGSSIPYPAINHALIKISDKLGIVQCPDLHLFPEEVVMFELNGMEKPLRGMHRISCPNDFVRQIGDEFHNSYSSTPSSGTPSGYREILSVTGSEINGSTQTVVFHRLRQNWWIEPPNAQYSIDESTITGTYNLSINSEPCSGAMPNESVFMIDTVEAWDENYSYWLTLTRTRYGIGSCDQRPFVSQSVSSMEFFETDNTSNSGCYEAVATVSESINSVSINTYAIGWTGSSTEVYAGGSSSFSGTTLIYFKHGSEECGNPFTVSQLLGVSEIKLNRFTVSPNPVRVGQIINVSPYSVNSTVRLFSINGKQLPIELVNGTMKTDNLFSGIYLLRIQTESGVSTQKLVVTD